MKTILTITLLFTCVLGFGQQQVFKSPNKGDTIYYDPSNPPQVFKGGVEYLPSFSLPASLPKTNLLGYWSYEYGINSDSTIYLVDANNNPVDTIKLSGIDFSLSSGYIPLKTASTFTMQSINTIDTAFWGHDIYPTTVFQNVDYDSTTYFKVAEHVLNADSTELHPARITEIALYSQASDANSYFSVPEIGTVKWVDKNYTGSTKNGNWATPYITVHSAFSALPAGTKILIKSGRYVEENDPTTFRYMYLSKAANFNGIGNVNIQTVSNSYDIRFIGAATHNMTRLVIDGGGTTAYNADAYVANMTVNFNNCVFKGATTLTASTTVDATSQVFNFSKCVSLNGKVGDIAVVDNCSINESLIVDANYVKGKFYWNKINASGRIQFKTGTRINYNQFATGGYDAVTPVSVTGNYYVQHNTFDFTFADNGANINTISQALASSQAHPYIEYNTFVSNDTGTLSRACSFILLSYSKTPKINHNTFISKAKSQFDHISLTLTDSVTGKCEINYNYCSSNSLTSAIVNVGGEVLKTDKFNNTEFIGNKIVGHLLEYPTTAATTHAILMNGGVNFDIRYNNISNTHLGLVVKAGGEKAYTANGVMYNVFQNNNRALWIRGVTDLNIYNNTFIKTTAYDPYGQIIAMDENSAVAGTQNCERIKIKNSIIYSTTAGTKIYMDQTAADSSCTIENSLIWGSEDDVLLVGSTGHTLAESDADGYTVGCVQQNPNITSATQLWPITPISGVDLGASYDDGLNISTVWPNSIVTKQQGATWQMGAYVK